MSQVQIGINPYEKENHGNKKVFFDERKTWANIIVAAVARYGKSALIKLIAALIQDFRKILILDYEGEWSRTIYPNVHSKGKMTGIRDMFILRNFAFVISDFGHHGDWVSLGFPELACKFIAMIASRKDIHHDSTENFEEILRNLPTEAETKARRVGMSVEEFNEWCEEKFGASLGLEVQLRQETKQAMLSRFEFIRNYFKREGDGKQYVPDFGKLFMSVRHLCIDMGLTVGIGQSKAQAYFGKVLEQLQPTLKYTRPMIIVEEASALAPNGMYQEGTMPSSLYWLVQYAVRFQRYGVEIVYICQDLNMLYYPIVENFHIMLLGQLTKSLGYEELTRKLKWHAPSNYREFLMIQKGVWKNTVFVPSECPAEC